MEIQVKNFLNILNTAINNNLLELTDPDWDRLYEFAKHHSLLPIFYEGCNKYNEFQLVSEDYKNRIFMETIRTIMWQASRTEAFLDIYDKLNLEGITPLVLKGLICRETYGELSDHRPSGDEDIYIRKEDFEVVKDILIANGYHMEEVDIKEEVIEKAQEISFYNVYYDLHIEVHLNPMGKETNSREKMNSYFINAFDTCTCFKINGHLVNTLNHTDHFLFLFLHFYKHFTGSGIGLRQLLDILNYDKLYHNEIDWTVIDKIIKEMSGDRLYADILAIGNRYLGFQLNTKLKGYSAESLLEDMMDVGAFGNSTRDHALSSNVTTSAMNNRRFSTLRTIFPKAATLTKGYPVLYEKSYLLPIIWIIRVFKFIVLKDGSDSKMVMESLRLGKRRVQLLKKYGIIS